MKNSALVFEILLLIREIFKLLLKKAGDVISGSKGRQITKCKISLQILERCSSNLALVICIKNAKSKRYMYLCLKSLKLRVHRKVDESRWR